VDSDNDVEESDEANNTFSLIWPGGETITIIKERK